MGVQAGASDRRDRLRLRKSATGYPVTPHHTLVIPKRHVDDFFGLNDAEVLACTELLHRLKQQIMSDDPEVAGFNIGMNAGAVAGQTIFHCHTHLILRRIGDVENPLCCRTHEGRITVMSLHRSWHEWLRRVRDNDGRFGTVPPTRDLLESVMVSTKLLGGHHPCRLRLCAQGWIRRTHTVWQLRSDNKGLTGGPPNGHSEEQ